MTFRMISFVVEGTSVPGDKIRRLSALTPATKELHTPPEVTWPLKIGAAGIVHAHHNCALHLEKRIGTAATRSPDLVSSGWRSMRRHPTRGVTPVIEKRASVSDARGTYL